MLRLIVLRCDVSEQDFVVSIATKAKPQKIAHIVFQSVYRRPTGWPLQRRKEMSTYTEKKVQGITIKLTDEQKKQIQEFWKETGSLGRVEVLVDVVNDKISPASIQVGTAK